MYTSLHIQNFRGLRDLRIDDLGRINLIVGANNVGKTSVLESLRLFHASYDGHDFAEMVLDRGFRPESASLAGAFSGLFHDRDGQNRIVIEGMTEDGVTHSLVIGASGFDWPYPDQRVMRHQHVRLGSEATEFLVMRYGTSRNGASSDSQVTVTVSFSKNGKLASSVSPNAFGPVVMVSAASNLTVRELAARLTLLENADGTEAVIGALKALDERVRRIYVGFEPGTEQPVVNARIECVPAPLPLGLLGGGAGRLTDMLVSIPLAANGIALVDEVENGIYYGNLHTMWRALDAVSKEANVQFFATTHSLECVIAAVDVFAGDSAAAFRMHRLEREDDVIRVVSYDHESAESTLHHRLEFR